MTRNQDPATHEGVRRTSKQSAERAQPLTRLSAAEIARRAERQRPGIARTRKTSNVPGDAEQPRGSEPTGPVASGPAQRIAEETMALAGPRQMTIWEDTDDETVIAEWITATTRRDRRQDALPASRDEPDDSAAAASQTGRAHPTDAVMNRSDRIAYLRHQSTRDDPHLVAKVRPAIVNLVLEHRPVSVEADRSLTALGIRFGAWSLGQGKTVDGEFDPYRDLTEDRIAAFVRAVGAHLSVGTRDTYAAALRRLAAGPVNRHTGKRRTAVPPLPQGIEDGLWAAASAFTPTAWQHLETKTLLALAFGVGAMPAEITLAAPEDVLVDIDASDIGISVRLTRGTQTRVVPVLDKRYATWLAARSAQLAGQTYLFKPDRTDRRNAINSTTSSLARQNIVFQRLELNAARSTWAVKALRVGVPFEVFAYAAGTGPGTHFPTDLLAYIPKPDPAQVRDAFRRAMQHPRILPAALNDESPNRSQDCR